MKMLKNRPWGLWGQLWFNNFIIYFTQKLRKKRSKNLVWKLLVVFSQDIVPTVVKIKKNDAKTWTISYDNVKKIQILVWKWSVVFPQGCGYGCQLHHAVYCLIMAYGTGRTLVLRSKGWRWGHVWTWKNHFV